MSNIAISELNTTITSLGNDDLILVSKYNSSNHTYTSGKMSFDNLVSSIDQYHADRSAEQPIVINDNNLSIFDDQFVYDGNEKIPEIAVNGYVLDPERYTITYSDNINAGTCNCTVTGNSQYGVTGTDTVSFTIAPNSLNSSNVKIQPEYFEYDGTAKTIDLLTKDGKLLVKDTDYTISYSDNVNVGSCVCTINGLGNYLTSQPFTVSFRIISNNQCSASLGGSKNNVTCTAIIPENAYIYNTQSDGGNWVSGSNVTLTFNSDTTKTVYFKVTYPNYNDLGADYTFGMSITRSSSTTTKYSDWHQLQGSYTTQVQANNVRLSLINQGTYESDCIKVFGGNGYYFLAYRTKTTKTVYTYTRTSL